MNRREGVAIRGRGASEHMSSKSVRTQEWYLNGHSELWTSQSLFHISHLQSTFLIRLMIDLLSI
jgi:hypothetical protein